MTSAAAATAPRCARASLIPLALTGAAWLAAAAVGPRAAGLRLLLFVPPALVAAYLGGLWPGLLAAALSGLACAAAWLLLPGANFDPVALAGLVLVGLTSAWVVHASRRKRAAGPEAPRAGSLLGRQLRLTALEAQATRFQRFARDAPIGIAFLDGAGGLEFANDEYLRILGRSRAELEAERFRLQRGPAPEWAQPGLGPRHERWHVRPDGTRVPVLVGSTRQADGVAVFVLDLTAEKEARRALEESEARYRTLAGELESVDRRKDEFLSVLSHELRNPLAPIRNAVYLLNRGAAADPARLERMLGVIDRQVEHLARMVDDLLDVTRITRGRVELRREPLELGALVRRAGEDHRAMAEQAGLELRIEAPGEPLWVDADPTRIAQIAGNLLQNAVKFSKSGGAVTLSLARAGDGAELRVRDTGAGIEPELLARVFQPFVQAERTLARSAGGLGLGLALVKGLAEMHGGRVAAASAGPGMGAEFTVWLPLSAPAAARAEAALADTAAPRRLRVLVVEDNRDVADSLVELVEAFGHEVRLAHAGPDALAEARAAPPDVLLCDIGLPGMSGYEVASAFRADPALRGARLVAVSGYAQPEDRRRAAEAGFDEHVAKPPDPAALERLLARVAASREPARA
ncbi:hybrid sensor histidine kinase/response regulator [Anaeromyxobacter paludicola]|uniref:histidine kinase n=1 Tax=Anaeromyxobacter paludicola TaxID=2918171 RepID=A0ABN6NAT9_9BACT|nr:ATP-binding protein [Anaeromyxobacter paludicola]BDG09541.1 hypothetical protein AMPC_26540 [Anaeromyxobacter paludicola]